MSTPSSTASPTPASGASGKPMPASTARCDTVKPETPARASWTTEIWPTNPVMTTSDSAITTPISVLISAWRKSNGSTTNADRAHDRAVIAGAAQPFGARHERQPLLDELAAARQRRAAQEHRRDDDQEGDELLDAGQRHAVVGREPALVGEVVQQRVDDPDAESGGGRDGERRQPREQRGGERGDDLERQRDRVELGDRGGEHADRPRHDARQQRVDHRQAVRRQAGEQGGDSFSDAARVARPNRLQR